MPALAPREEKKRRRRSAEQERRPYSDNRRLPAEPEAKSSGELYITAAKAAARGNIQALK